MRRTGLGLLAVVALASCEKVPVVDIHAAFGLAEAAWFEEEQTLFFFYRVAAQQGISEESRIEVAYRTDAVLLDWTATDQLTPVHTHLPVDCGPNARCGSLSLHVPMIPREVGIRLRYHHQGALALQAETHHVDVASGPAHTQRSLIVYGVFDQHNARVQWRARHQFPAVRNQEAEGLGLRRWFSVEGRTFGALGVSAAANPYLYGATGAACPAAMTPLGSLRLETQERAVFEPDELPLTTSEAPEVCAVATVTDALGPFQAVAVARKNPEVREAFPALRSPITVNTQLQFLLRICDREISAEHLAMQQQRLLLEDPEEVCLDTWQEPGFAAQVAARLQTRIDQERVAGQDMVLTLAVHHDDASDRLADVLELALGQVLIPERDKSSPRVSGAFVLDSSGHLMTDAEVNSLVLWCPNRFPSGNLDEVPTNAATPCPVQPDLPNLELGPFRFNTLPILPTRAQYQRFVSTYGEAQGGRMQELSFRAPEHTPLSENVPFGPFGVVTFFNNESLSAEATDAFSYCATADTQTVMFRPLPGADPMPISALAELHTLAPQPHYPLGLFWQFPFLLRLKYETIVAGAASAYDLTVPFGVGVQNTAFGGVALWERGEFPLGQALLQCSRFCEHPTFDQAGVYNVLSPFRETYRANCYAPLFPDLKVGGFPDDP